MLYTDRTLEILAKNGPIAADGTFRTRPGHQWSQIYSVHSLVRDRFVPCVIAFMAAATHKDYIRLFEELRLQMWNNLNVAWRPPFLLSDFEGALIKARKKIWPNLPHKGCFFHYKQTLLRHATVKCGLTEQLKGLAFRVFYHKIGALALIPQDDVSEAWARIREDAAYSYAGDPGVEKLLQYVEENWTGSRPAYPLRMWNHHVTLMAKGAKSTSELESNHKTMNANCMKVKKGSSDGFWKVLAHYSSELVNATRVRAIQIRVGRVRKRTSNGQVKRDRDQDKLREAVSAYDTEDIGGSLASIARVMMAMRLRRPKPASQPATVGTGNADEVAAWTNLWA
jgi:hypothetical protein